MGVALHVSVTRLLFALVIAGAIVDPARAQQQPATVPPGEVAPPDRAVTLTYVNRPIAVLRAQVLSRMPAERAGAAVRALDDLVARGITSPVATRDVVGARIIEVGGVGVVAILPADLDVLTGETLDDATSAAVSRLRIALAEAAELRTPGRVMRAVSQAVAVTLVLVGVLWLLRRGDRTAVRLLETAVQRRIKSTWGSHVLRATHLPRVLHGTVSLALAAGALVLTYLWLAFVLRRFPYTRPWGESLRGLLFAQIESLGRGLIGVVPNLLTVAFIILVARWASKGVALLFDAVEQGRVSMPGVYPDTAVPTRRLIQAALWLSALAMAYPYIPGSESSGVKGVSVFIGVVVSLGSTGVVQHLMAGLTLTFARAVRVGEFARLGDVEGTILQIGVVATKVRTPYGEEITIPNSIVMSQMTTNYSRGHGATAALLTTSVTIGYDTPWRQVEALLLKAAQCTPGLSRTPPAIVWRTSLDDYYVKYTLLVTPENPCQRAEVLDRLHTRILDAFNEHGVQIMSPHYMADPAGLKIVRPSDWYAAPAERVPPASARHDAGGEIPIGS
jgi:small-conductance mechanosensitive channel